MLFVLVKEYNGSYMSKNTKKEREFINKKGDRCIEGDLSIWLYIKVLSTIITYQGHKNIKLPSY